jgi:hypothetical protein
MWNQRVIWLCPSCDYWAPGLAEDPPDHCPDCGQYQEGFVPDPMAFMDIIGCNAFHREYEK